MPPSKSAASLVFDVKFKIVLVGESTVGKTSLTKVLAGEEFCPSLISTIGVDFIKKVFPVSNSNVMLEVWDTAGQERFHSIAAFHYRGTKAMVLIYDVTNMDSFRRLRTYWLNSAETHLEDPVPMFLLGNKIDIESKREVSHKEGEELAQQQCFTGFYETSAKTGEHVMEAFQEIAATLAGAHGVLAVHRPLTMDEAYYRGSYTPHDVLDTYKSDTKSVRKSKQLCSIKLRPRSSSNVDWKRQLPCCTRT